VTYLLLCAAFLLLALVVATLLRGHVGPSLVALGIAAAALVTLTAVFDNIMIAAGLFSYAGIHVSGVRIGTAPIEDFAYPLAAVILLPALWAGLRRRDDR